MFAWIKKKTIEIYRWITGERASDEIVPDMSERLLHTEAVYHPTCIVKAARLLNVSTLITDLATLYFLYAAAATAIDTCSDEFGWKSEVPRMVLKVLAMYCSMANVATNFFTINPVEEADVLDGKPEQSIEKDPRDGCERNLAKTLSVSNQVLANASYIVGSAAQIGSLTYFISNEWANLGVGIPLTAFGVLYYNLLTHARVTEHANVFIHKLLQKESMILNALRFPLRSFEVVLQSISNAVYRGISFGYVMDQLLLRLFKVKDSSVLSAVLIGSTTLLTFYITIFSRTLNVHKQYLNPDFEKISPVKLAETKISKMGFLADSLVTLVRSGSTGLLFYECAPIDRIYKIILGTCSGALLTVHGVYVRYKSRLEQTALDKINKDKMAIENLNADTIDVSALSKKEIFNKIRDGREAPFAKAFVTTLNTSARLGRSLSFIGFLIGLNEVLKNNNLPNLNFVSLLYLFGIWGITTLQNEWSFFESSMLNTVKYHTTKLALEAKKSHYGKWCSFFHSLNEYPKQYFQDYWQTRALEKDASLSDEKSTCKCRI